jgi:hypothetical protein
MPHQPLPMPQGFLHFLSTLLMYQGDRAPRQHQCIFTVVLKVIGVIRILASVGRGGTHFIIPALRRLRQEDWGFEASLGYKVSSRPVWIT